LELKSGSHLKKWSVRRSAVRSIAWLDGLCRSREKRLNEITDKRNRQCGEESGDKLDGVKGDDGRPKNESAAALAKRGNSGLRALSVKNGNVCAKDEWPNERRYEDGEPRGVCDANSDPSENIHGVGTLTI
jgi:hypothetical protein